MNKSEEELLAEYRLHHFEEAAKIRIQKYSPKRGNGIRCLDIGIGWGVVWRDFAKHNVVFGMDFSLGTLRTFRPKEYESLFTAFSDVKVVASEIFFHPEFNYLTNNRILAQIDYMFRSFPLSKLVSRQLTAVCRKL